jgi:beta-glucosidase
MLNIPATTAMGKNVTASARVTNTGKMNGEESSTIIYITSRSKSKSPIKALKGFQRTALKAGESKVVSFTLTPEQLSLVNEDGKAYQPTGKLVISIGGGQPGVKNKTTSGVVSSKEIMIL